MSVTPLRRRLEAVEARHTGKGQNIVVEFRPRGLDDAAFAEWHRQMIETNSGRHLIVVVFVSADGKVA